MIVRPDGDRILLITQPDHAHLARRVMEHCVPLTTRPRRDAILHAIAEHDNGWAEEDASPRVDYATGHIIDFVTASAEVRQRVWPRAVTRLARDSWAAALVAQHAITVYDRFRSDGEWTPFFAEMEDLRGAMLRVSGLPLDELQGDYVFVRLADLISLTFCTGWADEQRFGEWTVRLSGARSGGFSDPPWSRVVVAPDAFGGVEIPIEINAREIRNQPFQSDQELREVLSDADATVLRGMVTSYSR